MTFLFSEIIQTIDGDYLWNHLWINLNLLALKIVLVMKNTNCCSYKLKKDTSYFEICRVVENVLTFSDK